MRKSESYVDIVWRQFQKNRAAAWALRVFIPLVLIAIFAPLIASNQPLIYFDSDGSTLFPWFRSLFNPEETVDLIFNLALVGFFPWAASAFVVDRICRRREVPGRRRLLIAGLSFASILALLVLLFVVLGLRPQDRDRQRTFAEEEFRSAGAASGIYPLIPYGPNEPDLDVRMKPPFYRKPKEGMRAVNQGFVHLFGTDNNGRDVLVRMIYGARISLTVGFVAVGIYVPIGIILGALAGYFGGRVDLIISRAIEVMLLFPSFFLILTLVGLIGPSIYIIMVVIGLTGWPTIARLIRGEVLKQRGQDYVSAARSLGASHLRILFRHILPNALSPAMVAAPFGIAGAIVTEAGLSLLGFGVRPPAATWGVLLNLASTNYSNWWLVLFPSIAIFVTVTVFNLVGNGFRDAMDPRLRM
jgi:peptide/nickel transport system permease protein